MEYEKLVLSASEMDKEAAMFKVLANPVRLRLAILLAIKGETFVYMLANDLDVAEYTVSHHLGIMRSAGIVEFRREGTQMHYKLSNPRNQLEKCLQKCLRDCFKNHNNSIEKEPILW